MSNKPDRANSGLSPALKFVLMVGAMSFFADFTYEGSRSVIGQYLGTLGAGALIISVVTGFGEFLGYGLRLLSGRGADRTGKYWPITICGYLLQMSVVPLLAVAGSWPVAAVLIVLERVGKAIRNPPRDAMLSHAAAEMGYGWGFGVHEALDQFGALFGPLAIAWMVAATHNNYQVAFVALAVPAGVMLSLLAVARLAYPRPHELAPTTPTSVNTQAWSRVFWLYLVAAALVAAGFADFPLLAFHFQQIGTVPPALIPIFYAAAMGISGTGSLVFGRLLDRFGIRLLLPLTLVTAAYAPMVFLGGFWPSLVGICPVGAGRGRARVDYPGRGRPHGFPRSTSVCLRTVHRDLWHLLVRRQCRHRRPVQRLLARSRGLLRCHRTRRYPCRPARLAPHVRPGDLTPGPAAGLPSPRNTAERA